MIYLNFWIAVSEGVAKEVVVLFYQKTKLSAWKTKEREITYESSAYNKDSFPTFSGHFLLIPRSC